MKLTSDKILKLYRCSKVIKNAKELRQIYKERDKKYPLGFDTETTSETFNTISHLYIDDETTLQCPYPFVFGISMAIMLKGKIYLLWARYGTPLFKAACKIINKKSSKTAHNARYDIRVMEENGFNVKPVVECTYTMARIYWDRRQKHSLKAFAEIICPELSGWDEPIKNELRRLKASYTRKGHPKNFVNYSFVSDKLMSKYSKLDSFWALILWIYFGDRAIWK